MTIIHAKLKTAPKQREFIDKKYIINVGTNMGQYLILVPHTYLILLPLLTSRLCENF